MRVSPNRSLLLSVIFLVICHKSFSQDLRFDSSSLPAVKDLAADYNKTFVEQLHLYNGIQYREYHKPFDEGQPYFVQNSFSRGTVSYDGGFYENVSILYNLVTDQVIILGRNNIAEIQLLKDKVSAFSLQSHTFINMHPDTLLSTGMPEGFYDLLTTGKTSLLAKRTKNIQSFVQRTIILKVFEKDHYYVKKNNSYVPIRSKKALLAQVSDKKKEIQQYLKDNKIRYRKDPENAMTKVIDYYNQLTN